MYVPSASPVALMVVSVLIAVTDAEFHKLSAALVMVAKFVTDTLVFTRYSVPVSVLWPVAVCELRIDAVVAVAVGAVMSFHCAYNVISLAT